MKTANIPKKVMSFKSLTNNGNLSRTYVTLFTEEVPQPTIVISRYILLPKKELSSRYKVTFIRKYKNMVLVNIRFSIVVKSFNTIAMWLNQFQHNIPNQ